MRLYTSTPALQEAKGKIQDARPEAVFGPRRCFEVSADQSTDTLILDDETAGPAFPITRSVKDAVGTSRRSMLITRAWFSSGAMTREAPTSMLSWIDVPIDHRCRRTSWDKAMHGVWEMKIPLGCRA